MFIEITTKKGHAHLVHLKYILNFNLNLPENINVHSIAKKSEKAVSLVCRVRGHPPLGGLKQRKADNVQYRRRKS